MSDDDTRLNTPARTGGSWTPMQREWVRLYTDPTMPTYMDGIMSGVQAGYAKSTARKWGDHIFKPHVAEEVDRIFAQRIEQGRDLLDRMFDKRDAALMGIIEGLQTGRDMHLVDPEEEFGAGMEHVIRLARDEDGNVLTDDEGRPIEIDHTGRLREINRHNKNVIKAKTEARKAAEKILAYAVGEPEQVIRHRSDEKPDERTLEGYDDDDLMDVQSMLDEEIQRRREESRRLPGEGQDDGPVEEADYEIVD